MLIIFVLSSTPGEYIEEAGFGNEVLHINAHFLLFFLLFFMFYKASKNIILSILLCIIYAFIDELRQSYVPNRNASFFDVQIDALGAILGGLILWKLQLIIPKKLKDWLNS